MVEGVDEDEQGQLEHETTCGYGVNIFRKANGKLAEGRFHALAKMLEQKLLGRLMGPRTVLFAGRDLLPAGGFSEYIL